MTVAYKVLGQLASAAITNENLYEVPVGKSAVCSSMTVCNRGASTTFRVAVRPAGAVLADHHYVIYDNYVNQYDTLPLMLGMTLAAGDIVTVYAGAATLSFSLFGSEIT